MMALNLIKGAKKNCTMGLDELRISATQNPTSDS